MITIDFNKLTEDLLPVINKNNNISINNLYQFIISCIKPIKNLYTDFINYRVNSLFEINHNGQVISLEHFLNTKFGLPFPVNHSQSIWIEDGNDVNFAYLFQYGDEWENSGLNIYPVYCDDTPPMYIFQNDEPNEFTTVDFKVHYPNTLSTQNINYMISVINKYKIAGFKYSIQSYTPSGTIVIQDPYQQL